MRANVIGMPDNLDAVLVVLLERVGQLIERRVEIAGDIRRVGGKSDIARHDQLEVIPIALHLNPGSLHAATQFSFLLVRVIAVTTGCRTAHRRTDQRALAAILLARRGRPDCRARQRTQGAVGGRLTHFTVLTHVRVLHRTASRGGHHRGNQ